MECPPTITQEPTGYTILHKPQWLVTIWMGCHCDLYRLQLICPGFASVDPRTNPAIIQMYEPDHCLINQGNYMYGYEAYRFTYAWDKVNFNIKRYLVNCTWYGPSRNPNV
ncbi:3-N-Acetylglucosaminyltransferase family protein [Striga asiatica]|uniref:3-N-Acetylglucosaminyltransferase family protein n=1 Tax=Striga asiatica TaxID=4170 RepID=A0A5A7R758_STRAF|nr:3-N-Acetylglucosaminyltransferase family protein [Striga asiatica]